MKNKNKKTKVLVVGPGVIYGKVHRYVRGFKNNNCDADYLDIKKYYKTSFGNRIINWFLDKLTFINNNFGYARYLCVSKLNNKLLSEVDKFSPDFLFLIKPVRIKPKTIKSIKKKNVVIFSFFTDSLKNVRTMSIFFKRSFNLFDCHFTSHSPNIDISKKWGAKRIEFLPHAVDTENHHLVKVPEEEKEKWGADIVFIGNCHEKNRAVKMNKLCELGYDVKVYGPYWENCKWCNCLKKKGLINGPAYGDKFNKIMSSSKIAMGFLNRKDNAQQTSRTYEIPATGIFMFHERTNETLRIYKEGKEVDFFNPNNFKEMKSKIDYYLTHPKERDKIAKAGYEKAVNYDFSYKARAKKVLEVFRKLVSY